MGILVRTNLVLELPSKCPNCEGKLNHVNALKSEAKLYMVFCRNPKCRYCAEIQIRTHLGKEVKVNCL